MLSPENTIFTQEDFEEPEDVYFRTYKSRFMQFLQKIQPDISMNLSCKANYAFLSRELANRTDVKILIIGGSIDGYGIGELKNHLPPGTLLVEADVTYGPNTKMIFDSHEIPFKDETFDLVIAQAVLEHVLDPFICAAEMNRVLKSGGMVYAETPFMQQVHGGKYDFHRFTHLGHRRLFRKFKEIKSGIVSGAGSSLAWSLKYVITSFARNKKVDKVLSYGSAFLFFWVKYLDLLIGRTRGSLDSACGYYFIGRKEPGYTLSDKELLDSYKGLRGNVK
jgi:SAM-dependent methyltransferase